MGVKPECRIQLNRYGLEGRYGVKKKRNSWFYAIIHSRVRCVRCNERLTQEKRFGWSFFFLIFYCQPLLSVSPSLYSCHFIITRFYVGTFGPAYASCITHAAATKLIKSSRAWSEQENGIKKNRQIKKNSCKGIWNNEIYLPINFQPRNVRRNGYLSASCKFIRYFIKAV